MSDARACLRFGPPGSSFCSATCHPVAEGHALFVGWWRAVNPSLLWAAPAGLRENWWCVPARAAGDGHHVSDVARALWIYCLSLQRVLQLRDDVSVRQRVLVGAVVLPVCEWKDIRFWHAQLPPGIPTCPFWGTERVFWHYSSDVKWCYKSHVSGCGVRFDFIIFSKTLIFIGFEVWGRQWPKASLNINCVEVNE